MHHRVKFVRDRLAGEASPVSFEVPHPEVQYIKAFCLRKNVIDMTGKFNDLDMEEKVGTQGWSLNVNTSLPAISNDDSWMPFSAAQAQRTTMTTWCWNAPHSQEETKNKLQSDAT